MNKTIINEGWYDLFIQKNQKKLGYPRARELAFETAKKIRNK